MFVPGMEVTSRLLCAISSKEPLCIVFDAFFMRKRTFRRQEAAHPQESSLAERGIRISERKAH
ncbi:hypothetical protein KSB_78540 [Ktedonobacter robiniae]|uniref:Transposase IS701-like DDE domain-containing protein n=1 Tax=Ktedonobacter robiniae TaxID=2778365 RepID=A0ABQ3V3C6_9CHLR|nr:hypothetical protein KSB_78540 [Ktedonobacter robiniae]